ncbi:MFS transporter [Derxia gummosa]|uniref:MFS transporter n=1 Tax=Derxia gummosa DSM 723 TaxID=1121388 RepID=A0A8B6XAL5_9BURK|nr:MFS transporter [Derxia gummosa]
MSPALLALAISTFAIGTTEFVVMGLLPEVARDLAVSIPVAGWLVGGYALGVAFGAPLMAIATRKLERKAALVLLMAIFIAGNVMCATAGNYWLLMAARVVTSLCHGAFFGIGSVVAATLAAPGRQASAVSLVFAGLTISNIIGVPLGTALGQHEGWRATFWAVSGLGVIALASLLALLPRQTPPAGDSIGRELRGLADRGLLLALATTVMSSAAMFTLFTYIAPLLLDVTKLSPEGVTGTLLVAGVGATVGNLVGGRMADAGIRRSLAITFISTAVIAAAFALTARSFVLAEITVFLWSAASFTAGPALQLNVVNHGHRAPNLVATLNIGAFNLGNAIGAWLGGVTIDAGLGLGAVPIVSALAALVGLAVSRLATAPALMPKPAHDATQAGAETHAHPASTTAAPHGHAAPAPAGLQALASDCAARR